MICRAHIVVWRLVIWLPVQTLIWLNDYWIFLWFVDYIAHLPRKLEKYPQRRFRTLASTYVTFDPTGRYLLANLGGEQIYLYDCVIPNLPTNYGPLVLKDDELIDPCISLPPAADKLKLQANAAFQQSQFTTAIGLYSKALLKAPKSAVLYSNRAAALMKRDW